MPVVPLPFMVRPSLPPPVPSAIALLTVVLPAPAKASVCVMPIVAVPAMPPVIARPSPLADESEPIVAPLLAIEIAPA